MKPLDQWTLKELESPVLVGTDEGTHGMPDTVRVYERIDGTLCAVYCHGGSEIGRGDVSSMNEVVSPAPRHGGRMRWFEAPAADHRRARAELLRYAATVRLYTPSNMPEHVVVQHGGKWWALPVVAGGWARRTEYRVPEHMRRQCLTPYTSVPVSLILLYGIPAE